MERYGSLEDVYAVNRGTKNSHCSFVIPNAWEDMLFPKLFLYGLSGRNVQLEYKENRFCEDRERERDRERESVCV